MIQVIYVNDGNVRYFRRSVVAISLMSLVYCSFCMSFGWIGAKYKANISTVKYHKDLKKYILQKEDESWEEYSNYMKQIECKMTEYYKLKKMYYRVTFTIILLINTIIFVLFWYLFFTFGTLYLRRMYPFCIFCLLFGIYARLYDNIRDGHISSFIKPDVHCADNIIKDILDSHINKQRCYFAVFVISGIIIITYYSWEIFSKAEYDMVSVMEESVHKLWINPKVFKTKSGEWSSSCYIEIPREIALLIFDHPNLKYNNDVKFYVRESDQKTLVCRLVDGSVMYFEINLY